MRPQTKQQLKYEEKNSALWSDILCCSIASNNFLNNITIAMLYWMV